MTTLAEILSEAKGEFDDRRSRYPTECPYQTAFDVAINNTASGGRELIKLTLEGPHVFCLELEASDFEDSTLCVQEVARVAVFNTIRAHLEQFINEDDDDAEI